MTLEHNFVPISHTPDEMGDLRIDKLNPVPGQDGYEEWKKGQDELKEKDGEKEGESK